jgi:HEAT repeat protein
MRALFDLALGLLHPDAEVREASILGLGDRPVWPLTRLVVVTGLTWALRDREEDVRVAAVLTLGALGSPTGVEPRTGSFDNRDGERAPSKAPREKVGGRRAATAAARLLVDISAGERVQTEAIRALGQIRNPVALEPLLEIWANRESSLRSLALPAIAEIEGERFGARAMAVLSDAAEVQALRAFAARQIGMLKHAPAFPVLKRTALDAQDAEAVRADSANALVALADNRRDDVVRVLRNLLTDELASLRYSAIRGLGVLGDAESVPKIAGHLEHGTSWVRKAAAEALGTLQDPTVLHLLQARFEDEDRDVREAARMAVFLLERRRDT